MLNTIEERRHKIYNQIKLKNYQSISELIELVNYSESTIKRDLISLEEKNLIRRTQGGALIIDNKKIDLPYLMKLVEPKSDERKHMLGNLSEELIEDDMVIFIDSSTTCLHIINNLSKYDGLHVITNGLHTATMLSEYTNVEVSILGGNIQLKRGTINGAKTYKDILSYNADIAFMSCRGFDINYGTSETMEDEALIKSAFREQSNKTAVLVTDDKMNKKYTYRSLSPKEIDYVITNDSKIKNISLSTNSFKIIC